MNSGNRPAKIRNLLLIKNPAVQQLLLRFGDFAVCLAIVETAEFFRDLLIELAHRFSGHCQHLHQQCGSIDAVLAGNMTPDCQSAGGFAANNGIGFSHLRRYIFESHRHLIAFLSVGLCHPVQQMRGGGVANAGSQPAPIMEKIIIQQCQQHVGMNIVAIFVDNAQPVRIAVGGHTQVVFAVHHIIGQLFQRALTWGGHFSAKQGVVLLMDHVHIAAASEQNRSQTAVPHAVHGVDGDTQVRLPDLLHIHHAQHTVDIFVKRIPFPHNAGCQRLGIRNASDILRPDFPDLLFDLSGDGFVRIPAACSEDLNSVVDGRVVAGCDGHTVGQAHPLDCEHDQGCRGRTIDHIGSEAVSGQNLRRPEHGFL